MTKKKQKIYLIDGYALCYRAYYAIQDLSTSRGMPTNAIYGFVNMLRKFISDYGPEMLTVVFDMKGPTVRHKKYEDYKIHRKPMPDDLISQIPRIKEIVEANRIPVCQLEGYEADDIIATLARKAEKKGYDVTIVTSDKDALQLVDETLSVLSTHTSGDKIYGINEVREKFGVDPEQMVDVMALMGDASDNIPGIKGIGPVTAGKLIRRYASLKGVYDNIEEISPESLRKKLLEGKDMAELSMELARLDCRVPIELDLEKTYLAPPDTERLAELYREFEFGKLLKEILPKEKSEGKYYVLKDSGRSPDSIREEIVRSKIVSISGSCAREDGGIAFSWKRGEACFVSMKEARDKKTAGFLKAVLEDETLKKTGYDIKRAILAFRKSGLDIGPKGAAFDVMIADYLIDPSRTAYDLSAIAMRHIGYNLADNSGVKWEDGGQGAMEFSHNGPSRTECEKADIIMRLHEVLGPLLEEKHLTDLFRDVEMPLVGVLADMEENGIDVDVEYLKERGREIGKELDAVSEKIYAFAGEKFNINSPKQVQYVLYEKLGLPATKKTKTGRSTDESVLRKLAEHHEIPRLLLEHREMSKLKSGYYDSILALADEETHRLHTHFNQAVTATGRLSSSEPNLQNIPVKTPLGKEIRRAFVSGGDKMILLAADYSQIELRILAHLSGDERLIEAFKNDEDVHRFTASLIFDCPVSEVTSRMRSIAKTVNFGIVYGMSPFGLAKDLEINIEDARNFIDAYFRRYPGVREFMDRVIDGARKDGFVTTLLKRRRYIPEINSSNERIRGFAERAAVNTPVQGSAADLIKLAMIECHNAFKGSGVKMVLQVHDELVFRMPGDIMANAAKRVKEIMEGVIRLRVPLKVDMESGKNWLDMQEVKI
ncbi:MAG: DNA polymerase I [Candidatus Omnitrophota bacterium]